MRRPADVAHRECAVAGWPQRDQLRGHGRVRQQHRASVPAVFLSFVRSRIPYQYAALQQAMEQLQFDIITIDLMLLRRRNADALAELASAQRHATAMGLTALAQRLNVVSSDVRSDRRTEIRARLSEGLVVYHATYHVCRRLSPKPVEPIGFDKVQRPPAPPRRTHVHRLSQLMPALSERTRLACG